MPCGKCNFCLVNRRNDWTFRLTQEHKKSTSAHFVTLTYTDDSVPVVMLEKPFNDQYAFLTLEKVHLQLFIKRLRKKFPHIKGPKGIRYYAVGEYGTKTQRPHYHLIIFNLDVYGVELQKLMLETWQYGQVHVGEVTPASIHYVTKFHVNKLDAPEVVQKPFRTYVAPSRNRGRISINS